MKLSIPLKDIMLAPGNLPNAYYGLALLYRMAGEFKASKDVLETMFVRIRLFAFPCQS